MTGPDAMPRKRVAIMQPYFLPYAGYFRLFAGVDEFVLYDCVQFPRRGRVHRTELSTGQHWLTLPLARQSRDVLIRELAFAQDARERFDRMLDGLPWLAQARGPAADSTRALLRAPLGDVTDFLEASLLHVVGVLCLKTSIRRSSAIDIDPALRGQDRIIAIAQAVGASHYLNSPGGRGLYDPLSFAEAGLQLEFLPPYRGPFVHLLPALVTQDPAALRADVLAAQAPPQ